MVRPEKRRQAPVAIARKLLEAVSYIRQQKQIPNLERITKYMQRVYDMGANECRRQLNNTVSDGLITEYLAVGFKGCRTGLEQEGYKIPSGEEAEMVSYLQCIFICIYIYCKMCQSILHPYKVVPNLGFYCIKLTEYVFSLDSIPV